MRFRNFRYFLAGLCLGEPLYMFKQRIIRQLCGSINVSMVRQLVEKEQRKLSELDEEDIRKIIDSVRIGAHVDIDIAFMMRDKFTKWYKGEKDGA